jgi:hypothetical protein
MTMLSSSVTVTGQLLAAGDQNFYTVYLDEGQIYDFSLVGDNPGNQGYLADPLISIGLLGNGNQINASDDDSGVGWDADLHFGAFQSGYYVVTVESGSAGSGIGLYDLTIVNESFQTDLADRIGSFQTLTGRDTLVSTIDSPEDADFVGVHLKAGVQYVFDARGAATGDGTLGDPFLTLLDREGTVVLSNDDGGTGNNAHIVFTPAVEADYWLKVDGFSNAIGSYELQMNGGTSDVTGDYTTAATLSLGATIQGRIEFVGDKDAYWVQLIEGATYQFDLSSDEAGGVMSPDARISLFLYDNSVMDGDGSILVATDDNNGPGVDEQITFTAEDSGLFYVRVSDSGGVGNYELSVSLVSGVPSTTPDVDSLQNHPSHTESMTGSDAADRLAGGQGDDTIDGRLGNDTMVGGTGNDAFWVESDGDVVLESAGAGSDTVNASITYTLADTLEKLTLYGAADINGTGNAAGNNIRGSEGNNLLTGMGGSDTINGGLGDDTIVGGANRDVMTGSGGLDHFVYKTASDSGVGFNTIDVINTFAHGDKIDLSAIDTSKATGDQAFTFVDQFTGVAGEVQWDQTGASSFLVQGDMTGDGVAEFSIQINVSVGFGTIHNWDFIL